MRLCFCLFVFGLSGFADVVTVGGPPDVISGDPFAAPLPGFPGTRYQQAFAASDFTGPMSITSISFFNTSPFQGPLPTATYTMSLSTITSNIDSLSNSDFDSNDGSDNALFAYCGLSGPAPGQLVFTGQPFQYNPAMGNLLLDIRITNQEMPGGAFFDGRRGTATGIFSRYQNFSGGNRGFGLVTEFDFVALPEPSMTGLLVGFLGAVIYISRTRRNRGINA